MPEILLPHQWAPRPYQEAAWRYLHGGGKRAALCWHRRAGKDDLSLHWAACALHERVGTYWHMLPLYSQARKAIWEAINPNTGRRRIDDAFPHELRTTTREDQMFIKFKNGSTWQLVGSDSYDSLVGSPPVGVVFSEWSLCDPAAWGMLSPILRENNGWAVFIYTPRGKNHGHSLIEMALANDQWFGEILTVDHTKRLTPEELEEERQSSYIAIYGDDFGEALFQQEYYCSFSAAVLGAYWAKQIDAAERENRIGFVPYDPALPVHVSWDLGIGDEMALWFAQFVGQEIRAIDFMKGSSRSIPDFVKDMRAKPYVYGDMLVPHDAKVRELGTGRSRIETMISLGLQPKLVPNIGLQDGINAVRVTLPRVRFDKEKCATGLQALTSYRAQYDETKRILSTAPVHDWCSHPADSFRYLILGWREKTGARVVPVDYSQPTISQVTYGDVLADHARMERQRGYRRI